MIAREVDKIISDSGIEKIDPDMVFSYEIDTDVTSGNTDKIVILVTEISNRPDGFGSDMFISKKGLLQVQVFYPRKAMEYDTETEVENPLLRILEKNHWYCVIGGQVDNDPQTGLPFTTFHFQRIRKVA